jgi:hypothetical protein
MQKCPGNTEGNIPRQLRGPLQLVHCAEFHSTAAELSSALTVATAGRSTNGHSVHRLACPERKRAGRYPRVGEEGYSALRWRRARFLLARRPGRRAARRLGFFIEDRTLPEGFAKNSREHVVPLGPLALGVIEPLRSNGLLFPRRGCEDKPFCGFSKSKKSFDERLDGVAPWTLHDLRRTFSTGLAKLGVAPHIKEALLNHVDAKSEVEAIYDQYTYLPEMRAAMELWEHHVERLLGASVTVSAMTPSTSKSMMPPPINNPQMPAAAE